MSTRFHLYRHFDADGSLLYFGQSNNCFERLREHKFNSKWNDLIVTIRIERFASREEALAAERQAILLEKPRFNVREVPKEGNECRVCLSFSKKTWRRIEEWRGAQDRPPSRAQAIQKLAYEAIEMK
jgi:excinuclease UvrABC nuclease subunit